MKRDWLPDPPLEDMLLECGIESLAEPIRKQFKEGPEELVEKFKAAGMLCEGDRILEVECGFGRFARILLDESHGSYVGFCGDGGPIDWCNHEIASRDDRFQFTVLDMRAGEPAPWGDGEFDLVLLGMGAFIRVPGEAAPTYLSELARLTKPGGRVIVAVYFAVGQAYADTLGKYFFYERKPFLAAVDAAGFDFAVEGPARVGKVPNWCYLTKRANEDGDDEGES